MGRLDDALKVYDDFLDEYSFDEDVKEERDELFDKINQWILYLLKILLFIGTIFDYDIILNMNCRMVDLSF